MSNPTGLGCHAQKLQFKGRINGKKEGNMAKDGTNRGGRRTRAGSKPNALVDKIAAGKCARYVGV